MESNDSPDIPDRGRDIRHPRPPFGGASRNGSTARQTPRNFTTCESWTLTARLQRRRQAMETRCNRNILCISYKDHVTNEEVRAKIQQAIEPYEYLLTTVKRRKLQWYGHVSRSSGLAKTILQGAVEGGRRQGRQRKKWEDNIRKWTGLEFGKSQRAVENREKWRKLVAKSSVVPQRPSQLRD